KGVQALNAANARGDVHWMTVGTGIKGIKSDQSTTALVTKEGAWLGVKSHSNSATNIELKAAGSMWDYITQTYKYGHFDNPGANKHVGSPTYPWLSMAARNYNIMAPSGTGFANLTYNGTVAAINKGLTLSGALSGTSATFSGLVKSSYVGSVPTTTSNTSILSGFGLNLGRSVSYITGSNDMWIGIGGVMGSTDSKKINIDASGVGILGESELGFALKVHGKGKFTNKLIVQPKVIVADDYYGNAIIHVGKSTGGTTTARSSIALDIYESSGSSAAGTLLSAKKDGSGYPITLIENWYANAPMNFGLQIGRYGIGIGGGDESSFALKVHGKSKATDFVLSGGTPSTPLTYLPLTGGTLSGHLTGTSATFNGDVNIIGAGNILDIKHGVATNEHLEVVAKFKSDRSDYYAQFATYRDTLSYDIGMALGSQQVPMSITYRGAGLAVGIGGLFERGIALTVHGKTKIDGGLELFGSVPYIDFHYGNSTADFTHRILAQDNKLLIQTGQVVIKTISGSESKMGVESQGGERSFYMFANSANKGIYSTSGGYLLHFDESANVGVGGNAAPGYGLKVHGNQYNTGSISVTSITDRTPYPKDLDTAYDAIQSMVRLPNGEYKEDDTNSQLDHSKLHKYLKVGTDERNLSSTVSAHNEVVKDLIKRINILEDGKDNE
ncbi:MAG: hypothetical protein KAH32_04350, partial [Chlamydiia bacterium]|nr:hypothetical protein [Chlamydiia bacterium]